MRCGPYFFGAPFWETGRRGGSGFDAGGFMGGMWGGPGAKAFWGGGRRGRMFGQGDLKYVILQLLDEKPRHGYEIIKELEDRFGGMYSPSPGTVYPTLTMLEDMGYAGATPEESGKRIYQITDEGRRYLAENRDTVDDIFERIAQFGANIFGEAMTGVNAGVREVARAVYGAAPSRARDPEWTRRVREILERAARDIEGIGRPQG